jgi:dolichyl-phosphate-mannose-protein mannosyltransferase
LNPGLPARFTAHQRLAAWAIGFLAIGLRFYALGFGLPHWFTRPDEETAIIHAIRIAQGHPNPQWFHWPTLYMYVLAIPYGWYFGWRWVRGAPLPLGIAELYFAHPAPFHLLDRALSATAGVLTVYVLYRLARTFLSRRGALVAAFFLAVAPLHVRDSHFGVTDVAATLMVLTAVVAALAWMRVPSRGRLLLLGAACGLAASTKYNVGIVIVPAVLAVMTRAATWRSKAGDIAVLGATAVAAFLVGTPYALITPGAFLSGVRQVSEHMAAGHGLELGSGWWYHVHVTLRYGLGLPLLAVSLAGLLALAVTRPRLAAVLLSFPLLYYALGGSTHVVFFRYMLPAVPFLCLSAAYLVARLPGRTAALVAIAMMLPGLMDVVRLDRLLARTDTRVLAADWIRDHVPAGASLYQSGAIYGHLVVDPAKAYREFGLAGPVGPFTYNGAPAQLPDLIVYQESPLMYSREVPFVAETARRSYYPAAQFIGYDPAQTSGNVYDPIDAFFLPLRGFKGVERPGPNVTVYRRSR